MDFTSYRERSLVFLSSFCSLNQHFGNLKIKATNSAFTEYKYKYIKKIQESLPARRPEAYCPRRSLSGRKWGTPLSCVDGGGGYPVLSKGTLPSSWLQGLSPVLSCAEGVTPDRMTHSTARPGGGGTPCHVMLGGLPRPTQGYPPQLQGVPHCPVLSSGVTPCPVQGYPLLGYRPDWKGKDNGTETRWYMTSHRTSYAGSNKS